jgi:hypothetical protein
VTHKLSDTIDHNATLTKIKRTTSEGIGKVTSFVNEEIADMKNFIAAADSPFGMERYAQ